MQSKSFDKKRFQFIHMATKFFNIFIGYRLQCYSERIRIYSQSFQGILGI